MNKITRIVASCAVAACMLFSSTVPAVAATKAPSASGRVFVVLAPYLTWDDITAQGTPVLSELADKGAIGNINARSRTREVNEGPSPLEGALTLSAGTWAVPAFDAAAAYTHDEPYEYGTAGEAYERMTGNKLGGDAIAFLGLPVTQRENDARATEVTLGALGQAVVDAGGATVAIGNSDTGYVTGEQRKVRLSALVAMDEAGRVQYGDVSQDLLKNDPDAPFGIRTNLSAFDEALQKGLDKDETTNSDDGGPMLVVLDPGDLHRMERFAPQVADSVAASQRKAALRTLDTITGYASNAMEPGDTLIVTSQVSYDKDGYEGFGPVIVYGDQFEEGLLTSSSTHQNGLITNLDVSSTILSSMGVGQPVSFAGNSATSTPDARPLDSKVNDLSRYNKKAIAIESSKATTVKAYIALSVIVFVLATILILRTPKTSPRRATMYFNAVTAALMGVIAFPLASYLMFALVSSPGSAPVATASLIGAFILIMGAAALIWRFISSRAAFIFLMLGTAALLTVDQWVGYPLSVMGYLTYSPLLAARFYGIGNEGAALLFGASLVGFAMLLDMMQPGRAKKIVINVVFPVFAFVATITMAAPMWGANVGVILWGLVGYVVAWFLFAGHKITWKTVLLMLGAVALALGAFILYDLYGPGEPTHLARALMTANEGGLRELVVIITRKAQTSLRVLTFTNWSFMLIAVFVFLIIMRLRPSGDFAETLAENPMLAHALTASFVAGAAAMLSEDSGIVIPAIFFIYGGIAIVWAMLCHVRRKMGAEAHDGLPAAKPVGPSKI